MSNSTEPEDFEIESLEEAATSDGISAGDIEVWEPIQCSSRDFDIRSPQGQAPQIIQAGGVEAWVQVSTEKIRRAVALAIISLFAAWVFLGLILFTATGNAWLLGGAGVLALPLKYILDYYFHGSKQPRKKGG